MWFRRSCRVRAEEVEAKLALFEKLRGEKPSFTEAIEVPLAAVLVGRVRLSCDYHPSIDPPGPLLLVARALLPLHPAKFAVDEGVDVAVHHGVEDAGFDAGAKVDDFLVGLEDVAADL